ncbi:response regulator transcription factor [Nitrospirillum sp. BR 11164]|uniref:response regulator transcription factor n=1 Tax=Nitrospirillum sp. BR 11164 TaxID=3104324 RepID=UPI002AFE1504|nr:response regulator transcription factor [Nitrospirillum sp. BR 11164]MEA1648428.1 response regulator transcription factor [Nitrospirillum sp. BR 11164]
MSRLLIVEDEASLRDDLVAFLEAKGHAATGVGTLAEALHRMAADTFDLIVLDLGLPDGHGVRLLSEIRARRGLHCGVVVLTAHQDLEDKLQALEAGSDAYLVKHASLREIEFTIRNVLKRLPESPPPSGAEAGQEWMLDQRGRHLAAPGGESVPLTPKEMIFMALLAEAGTTVCDHARLAEGLGDGGDFSPGSLNAMVRRLRQKIEDRTGLEAPVRAVYGRGYSFAATLRLR